VDFARSIALNLNHSRLLQHIVEHSKLQPKLMNQEVVSKDADLTDILEQVP